MVISLIVAVAANNVIGKNNQLPWHLPADLKHFKRITTGHTVFMGRKTYDSIGKPLPNRKNVVISKSVKKIEGCEVAASLEEALKSASEEAEIFIIGGAEIFRQSFFLAERIELTCIHQDFDGDTFFPEIDPQTWTETQREDFAADEKNPFSYSFITLKRR
ncbi:dihydrofolate reductase [Mucilaginibacter arboris]|uniref:Dihydrofolate reductase n=1 Tax=Mucilaginibacter arboris TaxID=2682090 RepID=A0A7K1SYA2_9SPHI|nr:dihydrofolate reductase [Mucilaginibacter arboris]MVN22283.1 dihydrofolate reductase [Mucilaginibacter arboris]